MYLNIYSTKANKMDKNLASITWAHAVNDKAFLKSSLKSEVDMLEADVVMGRLADGNETRTPIMGHPPNDVSNLSLLEFLSVVDDFNSRSANKKGIKLDFKCIEAFDWAIMNEQFTAVISKANYPVWFNADVLEGPLAIPLTKPLDPHRFLKGGKLFPRSVLSLGWTTGFDPTKKSSYTESNTEEMLQVLASNEIRQPVTFAIRAGLMAESGVQMNKLLRNNNYTLTVWSGVNDEGFDVDKLNYILDGIGVNKIYIDVPNQLRSRLKLVNNSNYVNS